MNDSDSEGSVLGYVSLTTVHSKGLCSPYLILAIARIRKISYFAVHLSDIEICYRNFDPFIYRSDGDGGFCSLTWSTTLNTLHKSNKQLYWKKICRAPVLI